MCAGVYDIMFHAEATVCQSYIHSVIIYLTIYGDMLAFLEKGTEAPAWHIHTGIHT